MLLFSLLTLVAHAEDLSHTLLMADDDMSAMPREERVEDSDNNNIETKSTDPYITKNEKERINKIEKKVRDLIENAYKYIDIDREYELGNIKDSVAKIQDYLARIIANIDGKVSENDPWLISLKNIHILLINKQEEYLENIKKKGRNNLKNDDLISDKVILGGNFLERIRKENSKEKTQKILDVIMQNKDDILKFKKNRATELKGIQQHYEPYMRESKPYNFSTNIKDLKQKMQNFSKNQQEKEISTDFEIGMREFDNQINEANGMIKKMQNSTQSSNASQDSQTYQGQKVEFKIQNPHGKSLTASDANRKNFIKSKDKKLRSDILNEIEDTKNKIMNKYKIQDDN